MADKNSPLSAGSKLKRNCFMYMKRESDCGETLYKCEYRIENSMEKQLSKNHQSGKERPAGILLFDTIIYFFDPKSNSVRELC